MTFDWIMIAYIVALCALVLHTIRKEEPMLRTSLALFATMIAAYAYNYGVGAGMDYSVFMILVNALAARIVLHNPAGRWQAVIGVLFVIQIGTDTGRVSSDIYFGMTDMTVVYWMTTLAAFAQLALLGGWIVELGGHSFRIGHHAPLAQARGSSVV